MTGLGRTLWTLAGALLITIAGAVAPQPAQTGQQASAAPRVPATPQEYTVTEIKLVSGSCL